MIKLIVFAATLALTNISFADEIEFHVKQGHEDWAILTSAEGTALLGSNLAYVKLKYLNLQNNVKHQKPKHIESYRVALASYNNEGRWHLTKVAEPVLINRTLNAGQLMTVWDAGFDFELNREDLKKHWIAIEVTMDGGSTVYAHSRRDIFH